MDTTRLITHCGPTAFLQRRVNHLFSDGNVTSFLSSKDFWLYLQIRSQLTEFLGERIKLPETTNCENKLIKIVKKESHIGSKIYKIINTVKNTVSISREKTWKKDDDENIDPDTWTSIWQKLRRCLNSARNKTINYKFNNRMYYKLMNLYKNEMCWHCNKEKGLFFHMVCKYVGRKLGLRLNLSTILKENIPLDPKLCILNYMDDKNFKKKMSGLCWFYESKTCYSY